MLIDELITTNIKCFMSQEVICNSKDFQEVAEAAKKTQTLNARRNELIRALDKIFGDGDIAPMDKTYA